jgi:hypothetical protein
VASAVHAVDSEPEPEPEIPAGWRGTALAMSPGMTTTTFSGTPPALAYRDSLEGARIRYADLLARLRATPVLPGISGVLAARSGRTWAGAFGIAGAVLMAIVAGVLAIFKLDAVLRGVPTSILLLSWPAMGAGYVFGRVLGAHRAKAAAAPRPSGDVHADLAELERTDPVARARDLATRIAWKSTALPMIGVGMLAPLTIHFIAWMMLRPYSDVDIWIVLSLVIVGHAHLTLAFLYARFATRAGRLSDDELAAQRSRFEWRTYGFTVLASAIPGALLFAIPPVLTAATALVFHPLLFRTMTRTILAERQALA